MGCVQECRTACGSRSRIDERGKLWNRYVSGCHQHPAFYRMFHCFQPIQSKSDSADCMQWYFRLLYILKQLYSSLSGRMDWGVGIEKSQSANKEARPEICFKRSSSSLSIPIFFIIHLSDIQPESILPRYSSSIRCHEYLAHDYDGW